MARLPVKPAGIYIHIPFCVRKCPYCDFYSIADLSHVDAYVDALVREMAVCEKPPVESDTIYFGGGTPSLLSPGAVGRLMDEARRFFKIADNPEVTLEVNPGTVDECRLSDFRDTGINRLSVGVQSFNDKTLGFLGRIHDAAESKSGLRAAHDAGFENIGMDLICGIPGRAVKVWKKDLETAFSFFPSHLSCYMLTLEPGTQLHCAMEAGRFSPVPERLAADLFRTTMDMAGRAGYDHYEISNFAKSPALRSRHNLKYWTDASYIGLGASAHSFLEGERFWNVRSADHYIRRLSSGRSPVEQRERPDIGQQMIEAVYLGLRMAEGIDLRSFEQRFSESETHRFVQEIEVLKRHDLLEFRDGNRICLTPEGMLKADAVADRLIGCI